MYSAILITGGAGFVGSHLAIALKSAWPDAQVFALDNLRRSGSELNLPRLAAAGVRFVHGDVRVASDLDDLPLAPDLIIEASAEASVMAGYGQSPDYVIRTNLIGCLNCLELARKSHSDFLFLSTSRVYPVKALNNLTWRESQTRYGWEPSQGVPGACEQGISEDFPMDGARSLYGMSKLAAELAIEEYADAYGIRYIINRCGLLTGPWQMAKSDQGVIALWVARHFFNLPLRYIGFGGSGKQVRDFLHIDDFRDLVLLQLARFDDYQGQRFNVGGGLRHSISLLEATEICREVTGNSPAITPDSEDRPSDLRVYLSDCHKVTAVEGWRPNKGARETMADIHDWLKENEEALRGPLGMERKP